MHKSKNILVFSNYPVKFPRHGGQIRAKELIKAYEKIGKVTYSAVCNSAVYPESECTSWDLRVPEWLQVEIEETPYRENILIGKSAVENSGLNELIQQKILCNSPQILVIEQPYLWPAVKEALKRLNISWPRVVYSSHNYELEHFGRIMPKSHWFDQDQRWVEEAEKDLIYNSDLIISTTADETKKYTTHIQAEKIVLVRNGFSVQTDPIPTSTVLRIQQKIKFQKYALFVASAHQPNIEGFFSMIGTRLGFLPPKTGIVVAGTAGPVIGNLAEKNEKRWIDLFWSKIQLWGFATEAELSVLSENASLFILPILEGGGSNLKAAQALQSGKPIVATTHALRGFSDYKNSELIEIHDSKDFFKAQIVENLTFRRTIDVSHPKIYLPWDTTELLERLKKLM